MNAPLSLFKVLGRKGSVYELIDPRDGSSRYVGMTFNEDTRSSDHSDPRKFQASLAHWKDELFRLGLEPRFAVIERGIDPDDILERERFWTASRVSSGCRLLNRPAGRITRKDLLRPSLAMFVVDVCDDIESLLRRIEEAGRSQLPKQVSREFYKACSAVRKLKYSVPGY